jgi:MYXO-CTERM domain-containing protein
MNLKIKLPLVANCPAIVMALGLSGGLAFAAGTASDTASNYSGGGWGATPPNNGTGFGAWNISLANANNPPYVGTYLDTSSTVVSGGYAWGTYANNPTTVQGSISLSRLFTTGASGSSSLYDQTFSFAMASAGVGPGQGLLSAAVGTAFSFAYNGTLAGDNMYLTVDGGSAITTPVNFAELGSGLLVSLAVSGAVNSPAEGYTFTVSPFAGGSPIYTTSGTFDSSSFNTSAFTFTDSNTTGNGYLNNLNLTVETTPEPSTLVLGTSGLATLLLLRRRR